MRATTSGVRGGDVLRLRAIGLDVVELGALLQAPLVPDHGGFVLHGLLPQAELHHEHAIGEAPLAHQRHEAASVEFRAARADFAEVEQRGQDVLHLRGRRDLHVLVMPPAGQRRRQGTRWPPS